MSGFPACAGGTHSPEKPPDNLTIYPHVQAAVAALGAAVLDKLSKSERSGWEWLETKALTTSIKYAEAMRLPHWAFWKQEEEIIFASIFLPRSPFPI